MIKIGVTGYSGRMGKIIVQQIIADDTVELSCAYSRSSLPESYVTNDLTYLFANSDVVIDFTRPDSLGANLPLAIDHKVPLVIGSTGLSLADKEFLLSGATSIPILYSTNMSVGVNIMFSLVEKAAAMMGGGYDVEISEIHHRHKADAPSGTAISLGEAVQQGLGEIQNSSQFQCRTGARQPGEIGFAVMRGGQVTGDHTVNFIGDQDIISISHHAMNPIMYATGAIKAAKWIINRNPGLYSMKDVLGIY